MDRLLACDPDMSEQTRGHESAEVWARTWGALDGRLYPRSVPMRAHPLAEGPGFPSPHGQTLKLYATNDIKSIILYSHLTSPYYRNRRLNQGLCS